MNNIEELPASPIRTAAQIQAQIAAMYPPSPRNNVPERPVYAPRVRPANIAEVVASLKRDMAFVQKYAAEEKARRHELSAITGEDALNRIIEGGDASAGGDYDAIKRKHEMAKAACELARTRCQNNAEIASEYVYELKTTLQALMEKHREVIKARHMPHLELIFGERADMILRHTLDMREQAGFENARAHLGAPRMLNNGKGGVMPSGQESAETFAAHIDRHEGAVAEARDRLEKLTSE